MIFFLSRLTTTVSSRIRVHLRGVRAGVRRGDLSRAIAGRTSDGGAACEVFYVDLVVKIS